MAASAADLGAGSSTGAINNYMNQQDLDRMRAMDAQNQVTSITQFSDVQPTEWAYQALSNLVDKYGCVAGYPDGTFRGKKPLSRWEAAALLNSCLDRITEVTDELQRLLKDFGKELAILKGRVDKLDAKVGKLEAQQFSTTTKLQGDTYWSIGANAFGNNKIAPAVGPRGANGYSANAAAAGGAVFNYDLRLNLNTSFTGKDLLYTRLRAGNYGGSPFGGAPYALMALDRAFPGNTQGTAAQNNVFYLDRLYYRFPVGKEFTAIVGPVARNTEFLAIKPFYYGDFEGLDYFRLDGAPGAYNKATGGTVGLIWKQNVKKGNPFFALSSSYVAPGANNGATNNIANAANTTGAGVAGDYSAASWLTQVGYQAKQWKATFAYRYGQCNQNLARRGTVAGASSEACGNTTAPTNIAFNGPVNVNAFALGLAWAPEKNGTLVPSLSLGWGYNAVSQGGAFPAVNGSGGINANNWNVTRNIAATQSWTVGLQWKDAFLKGNTAGFAIGQPTFVTSTRNGQTPFDGNYAMEAWYKFQVSDNISVTPMLFYLSNPSSAGVYTTAAPVNTGASVFGGLLAAQFKF
ncbi:MAG: iron uptake porin [Synechococcaceae cyanobacterium ELA445]